MFLFCYIKYLHPGIKVKPFHTFTLNVRISRLNIVEVIGHSYNIYCHCYGLNFILVIGHSYLVVVERYEPFRKGKIKRGGFFLTRSMCFRNVWLNDKGSVDLDVEREKLVIFITYNIGLGK